MPLLVAVIHFLLYLLLIGLIFALVIWVIRDILEWPVSQKAIKIIGAILFLLVLLWFIQAFMPGGHPIPRLLLIAPG